MKQEYGFNTKDIVVTCIICFSLLFAVFIMKFYSYQSLLLKRNAFEICLNSSMQNNTLTEMANICQNIMKE